MGLFKKSDTTPRPAAATTANVPSPTVQAVTAEAEPSKKKKASFQPQSEADAAAKIQAIKRGQDLRRGKSAAKPPEEVRNSRRVSFDGGMMPPPPPGDGFLGALTASLNNCMASMPCLQPGAGIGARRASLPKDATSAPLPTEPVDAGPEAAGNTREKAELSPSVLEKVRAPAPHTHARTLARLVRRKPEMCVMCPSPLHSRR